MPLEIYFPIHYKSLISYKVLYKVYEKYKIFKSESLFSINLYDSLKVYVCTYKRIEKKLNHITISTNWRIRLLPRNGSDKIMKTHHTHHYIQNTLCQISNQGEKSSNQSSDTNSTDLLQLVVENWDRYTMISSLLFNCKCECHRSV